MMKLQFISLVLLVISQFVALGLVTQMFNPSFNSGRAEVAVAAEAQSTQATPSGTSTVQQTIVMTH